MDFIKHKLTVQVHPCAHSFKMTLSDDLYQMLRGRKWYREHFEQGGNIILILSPHKTTEDIHGALALRGRYPNSMPWIIIGPELGRKLGLRTKYYLEPYSLPNGDYRFVLSKIGR